MITTYHGCAGAFGVKWNFWFNMRIFLLFREIFRYRGTERILWIWNGEIKNEFAVMPTFPFLFEWAERQREKKTEYCAF